MRCRCPKIRLDASYLILDENENESPREARETGGAKKFLVGKKTTIIEWKREWKRKMKRFKKRSKKYCPQ